MKPKNLTIHNSLVEFLIFTSQSEANGSSIEVYYKDGSVWLTQKRIAQLFDVRVPTINEHLKKYLKTMKLNKIQLLGNS